MGSADTANTDLAYPSATAQLVESQAQRLSPVEVLQAQIDRIEGVGDLVNAITYTAFEDAKAAARESEARYRRGEARPLEGVTLALKDEDGLARWPMTAGSAAMADNVLEKSTPIVDLLQQRGRSSTARRRSRTSTSSARRGRSCGASPATRGA